MYSLTVKYASLYDFWCTKKLDIETFEESSFFCPKSFFMLDRVIRKAIEVILNSWTLSGDNIIKIGRFAAFI